MTYNQTIAILVGPWQGNAHTGLMQRCKAAWDTPLVNLDDLMVATFLNQDIAVAQVLAEARRRLKTQARDGSEYFDGQLLEATKRVQSSEDESTVANHHNFSQR